MDLVMHHLPSLPSSSNNVKSQQLQGRRLSTVSFALPETAASVAVTATLVAAAATLLVNRTKSSDSSTQSAMEKDSCSRNDRTKAQRGQDHKLRTWLLDSQQGFQRSGAIAQSALLADPVQPVMELAN
ncbi:uncharacterized protein [Arachis hypogaea]|uniref:uncharacterized protein isoform X2 n=1 Tax=Arachis hypogaea TaxID=3818 RepID=UPI000DEC877A|nr:uncharacterized protein LOC112785671 isoform X2 [Arachis hypogaea]